MNLLVFTKFQEIIKNVIEEAVKHVRHERRSNFEYYFKFKMILKRKHFLPF